MNAYLSFRRGIHGKLNFEFTQENKTKSALSNLIDSLFLTTSLGIFFSLTNFSKLGVVLDNAQVISLHCKSIPLLRLYVQQT